MNKGQSFRVLVDVLDAQSRFVTSADCQVAVRSEVEAWSGVLTQIEPYARLSNGHYRIRLRDGGEAAIHIQARQRIGRLERYPFVGEGSLPPIEGD